MKPYFKSYFSGYLFVKCVRECAAFGLRSIAEYGRSSACGAQNVRSGGRVLFERAPVRATGAEHVPACTAGQQCRGPMTECSSLAKKRGAGVIQGMPKGVFGCVRGFRVRERGMRAALGVRRAFVRS